PARGARPPRRGERAAPRLSLRLHEARPGPLVERSVAVGRAIDRGPQLLLREADDDGALDDDRGHRAGAVEAAVAGCGRRALLHVALVVRNAARLQPATCPGAGRAPARRVEGHADL